MDVFVEENSESQCLYLCFHDIKQEPDCTIERTNERKVAFALLKKTNAKIVVEERDFSPVQLSEDYAELTLRLHYKLDAKAATVLRLLTTVELTKEQTEELVKKTPAEMLDWFSVNKLISIGPFATNP
jgi:hypothetical protein